MREERVGIGEGGKQSKEWIWSIGEELHRDKYKREGIQGKGSKLECDILDDGR